MNYEENNLLIAEYMGIKVRTLEGGGTSYNPDLSWDLLMAVVERIEDEDIVASFCIEQPTIYVWASSESDAEDITIDIHAKTKLQAVYEAVVEFIDRKQ